MPWKALNPFDSLQPAETPDEMRAAIYESEHHHALVRQVMTTARLRGLKGEDVYAVLAYHALQVLTRTQQQLVEHMNQAPLSILVPADLVQR
jgi:hypothetical protein